jgi:hypothetical protein
MAWLKGQQPAAERVRLLLDAADRGERKLAMNIVNLGRGFLPFGQSEGPSLW